MQDNKKALKLRAVACLTLFLFLVNQVASANPGAGIQIAPRLETPSFLQIDIPEELATLDGLYEAPSRPDPKLILHVQNAHANYGAQVKIKELLQYLHKTYAFRTIFVEGASEDLDPENLKYFPDAERNIKLADLLTAEGKLTGAELFLLDSDLRATGHGPRDSKTGELNVARGSGDMSREVKAHGIENAKLYRENYDALKKVFGSEATVTRYVNGYEARLETLSSKVFTNDLRRVLGEWKKFEKGNREFMPYLHALAAEAKRVLGLDLESILAQIDWPQITRLLQLQVMEKDLQLEKALAEKEQLISFLAARQVSPELLSAIKGFQGQRVSVLRGRLEDAPAGLEPRNLMEKLFVEASPKGFRFQDYPEFSTYAGYLILKNELDPKGLYLEIKAVFARILDTLASDPRQKELLELYRDEELIRKLLHLELPRREWQAAVSKKNELGMDTMTERLKTIGIAVSKEEGLSLSQFETQKISGKFRENVIEIQAAAFKFYDAARKREDVFYQKIHEVLTRDSVSKAVLVTGGFHTDGITDLLREHEISYGILTPRLLEKSNEKLYRDTMLQRGATIFDVANLEAVSMSQDINAIASQIGKEDLKSFLKNLFSHIVKVLVGNPGNLDEALASIHQRSLKQNKVAWVSQRDGQDRLVHFEKEGKPLRNKEGKIFTVRFSPLENGLYSMRPQFLEADKIVLASASDRSTQPVREEVAAKIVRAEVRGDLLTSDKKGMSVRTEGILRFVGLLIKWGYPWVIMAGLAYLFSDLAKTEIFKFGWKAQAAVIFGDLLEAGSRLPWISRADRGEKIPLLGLLARYAAYAPIFGLGTFWFVLFEALEAKFGFDPFIGWLHSRLSSDPQADFSEKLEAGRRMTAEIEKRQADKILGRSDIRDPDRSANQIREKSSVITARKAFGSKTRLVQRIGFLLGLRMAGSGIVGTAISITISMLGRRLIVALWGSFFGFVFGSAWVMTSSLVGFAAVFTSVATLLARNATYEEVPVEKVEEREPSVSETPSNEQMQAPETLSMNLVRDARGAAIDRKLNEEGYEPQGAEARSDVRAFSEEEYENSQRSILPAGFAGREMTGDSLFEIVQEIARNHDVAYEGMVPARLYRQKGGERLPVVMVGDVYDVADPARVAKKTEYEPLSTREVEERFNLELIPAENGEPLVLHVWPHQGRNSYLSIPTTAVYDADMKMDRVYFGDRSDLAPSVLAGISENRIEQGKSIEFKGQGTSVFQGYYKESSFTRFEEVENYLRQMEDYDPDTWDPIFGFLKETVMNHETHAVDFEPEGHKIRILSVNGRFNIEHSVSKGSLIGKAGIFLGFRYQRVSRKAAPGSVRVGSERSARENQSRMRRTGARINTDVWKVGNLDDQGLGFSIRIRFGDALRLTSIDQRDIGGMPLETLWQYIAHRLPGGRDRLVREWLTRFTGTMGINLRAMLLSNLDLHEDQAIGKDFGIMDGTQTDYDLDDIKPKKMDRNAARELRVRQTELILRFHKFVRRLLADFEGQFFKDRVADSADIAGVESAVLISFMEGLIYGTDRISQRLRTGKGPVSTESVYKILEESLNPDEMTLFPDEISDRRLDEMALHVIKTLLETQLVFRSKARTLSSADQSTNLVREEGAAPTARSDVRTEITDQAIGGLYDEIMDGYVLYHGTSSIDLESIRQHGLDNSKKPFDPADMDFFEEVYEKATGDEIPLPGRHRSGIFYLTTDLENATDYASRGSEIVHIMLSYMDKVTQSGKLTPSEIARLAGIKDRYSHYLDQRKNNPVILRVKGSVLQRSNSLWFGKGKDAFIRQVREGLENNPVELEELKDLLLLREEVQVTGVSPDEILFPDTEATPTGRSELRERMAKAIEQAVSATDFQPGQLIAALKNDPEIAKLYAEDAGVWEGYTIEFHTSLAMKQFERYFASRNLDPRILKMMRIILALHDIGKPRGGKDKVQQSVETRKVIEKMKDVLPLSPADLNLGLALIQGDPIGSYLIGGPLFVALDQIVKGSQDAQIPLGEYFQLLTLYYQSDAGSYTADDEGGQLSLEKLFQYKAPAQKDFDEERGIVRFRGATAQLFGILDKAIRAKTEPESAEVAGKAASQTGKTLARPEIQKGDKGPAAVPGTVFVPAAALTQVASVTGGTTVDHFVFDNHASAKVTESGLSRRQLNRLNLDDAPITFVMVGKDVRENPEKYGLFLTGMYKQSSDGKIVPYTRTDLMAEIQKLEGKKVLHVVRRTPGGFVFEDYMISQTDLAGDESMDRSLKGLIAERDAKKESLRKEASARVQQAENGKIYQTDYTLWETTKKFFSVSYRDPHTNKLLTQAEARAQADQYKALNKRIDDEVNAIEQKLRADEKDADAQYASEFEKHDPSLFLIDKASDIPQAEIERARAGAERLKAQVTSETALTPLTLQIPLVAFHATNYPAHNGQLVVQGNALAWSMRDQMDVSMNGVASVSGEGSTDAWRNMKYFYVVPLADLIEAGNALMGGTFADVMFAGNVKLPKSVKVFSSAEEATKYARMISSAMPVNDRGWSGYRETGGKFFDKARLLSGDHAWSWLGGNIHGDNPVGVEYLTLALGYSRQQAMDLSIVISATRRVAGIPGDSQFSPRVVDIDKKTMYAAGYVPSEDETMRVLIAQEIEAVKREFPSIEITVDSEAVLAYIKDKPPIKVGPEALQEIISLTQPSSSEALASTKSSVPKEMNTAASSTAAEESSLSLVELAGREAGIDRGSRTSATGLKYQIVRAVKRAPALVSGVIGLNVSFFVTVFAYLLLPMAIPMKYEFPVLIAITLSMTLPFTWGVGLFLEKNVLTKGLPSGRYVSAERTGDTLSLHVIHNLDELRERSSVAFKLVLRDVVTMLQDLLNRIDNNDPKVRGVKFVRAESHLMADQRPDKIGNPNPVFQRALRGLGVPIHVSNMWPNILGVFLAKYIHRANISLRHPMNGELVIDITDPSTLEKVRAWVSEQSVQSQESRSDIREGVEVDHGNPYAGLSGVRQTTAVRAEASPVSRMGRRGFLGLFAQVAIGVTVASRAGLLVASTVPSSDILAETGKLLNRSNLSSSEYDQIRKADIYSTRMFGDRGFADFQAHKLNMRERSFLSSVLKYGREVAPESFSTLIRNLKSVIFLERTPLGEDSGHGYQLADKKTGVVAFAFDKGIPEVTPENKIGHLLWFVHETIHANGNDEVGARQGTIDFVNETRLGDRNPGLQQEMEQEQFLVDAAKAVRKGEGPVWSYYWANGGTRDIALLPFTAAQILLGNGGRQGVVYETGSLVKTEGGFRMKFNTLTGPVSVDYRTEGERGVIKADSEKDAIEFLPSTENSPARFFIKGVELKMKMVLGSEGRSETRTGVARSDVRQDRPDSEEATKVSSSIFTPLQRFFGSFVFRFALYLAAAYEIAYSFLAISSLDAKMIMFGTALLMPLGHYAYLLFIKQIPYQFLYQQMKKQTITPYKTLNIDGSVERVIEGYQQKQALDLLESVPNRGYFVLVGGDMFASGKSVIAGEIARRLKEKLGDKADVLQVDEDDFDEFDEGQTIKKLLASRGRSTNTITVISGSRAFGQLIPSVNQGYTLDKHVYVQTPLTSSILFALERMAQQIRFKYLHPEKFEDDFMSVFFNSMEFVVQAFAGIIVRMVFWATDPLGSTSMIRVIEPDIVIRNSWVQRAMGENNARGWADWFGDHTQSDVSKRSDVRGEEGQGETPGVLSTNVKLIQDLWTAFKAELNQKTEEGTPEIIGAQSPDLLQLPFFKRDGKVYKFHSVALPGDELFSTFYPSEGEPVEVRLTLEDTFSFEGRTYALYQVAADSLALVGEKPIEKKAPVAASGKWATGSVAAGRQVPSDPQEALRVIRERTAGLSDEQLQADLHPAFDLLNESELRDYIRALDQKGLREVVGIFKNQILWVLLTPVSRAISSGKLSGPFVDERDAAYKQKFSEIAKLELWGHGTTLDNLANIILEENIRGGRRDGEVSLGPVTTQGMDPSQVAGNFGVNFVIVDDATPNRMPNLPGSYHEMYLVPDNPSKEFLIAVIDQWFKLGKIDSAKAESLKAKVKTYQEVLDDRSTNPVREEGAATLARSDSRATETKHPELSIPPAQVRAEFADGLSQSAKQILTGLLGSVEIMAQTGLPLNDRLMFLQEAEKSMKEWTEFLENLKRSNGEPYVRARHPGSRGGEDAYFLVDRVTRGYENDYALLSKTSELFDRRTVHELSNLDYWVVLFDQRTSELEARLKKIKDEVSLRGMPSLESQQFIDDFQTAILKELALLRDGKGVYDPALGGRTFATRAVVVVRAVGAQAPRVKPPVVKPIQQEALVSRSDLRAEIRMDINTLRESFLRYGELARKQMEERRGMRTTVPGQSLIYAAWDQDKLRKGFEQDGVFVLMNQAMGELLQTHGISLGRSFGPENFHFFDPGDLEEFVGRVTGVVSAENAYVKGSVLRNGSEINVVAEVDRKSPAATFHLMLHEFAHAASGCYIEGARVERKGGFRIVDSSGGVLFGGFNEAFTEYLVGRILKFVWDELPESYRYDFPNPLSLQLRSPVHAQAAIFMAGLIERLSKQQPDILKAMLEGYFENGARFFDVLRENLGDENVIRLAKMKLDSQEINDMWKLVDERIKSSESFGQETLSENLAGASLPVRRSDLRAEEKTVAMEAELKNADGNWRQALKAVVAAGEGADAAILRMREDSTPDNRAALESAVAELQKVRAEFLQAEKKFVEALTVRKGMLGDDRHSAYLKDVEGTRTSNVRLLEGKLARNSPPGDYFLEELERLQVGFDPSEPFDVLADSIEKGLLPRTLGESGLLGLSMPLEVGSRFSAHGMWHHTSPVRGLLKLLREGLDPNRAINEMPITRGRDEASGRGAGYGAASPIDSTNGIMLVSAPDSSLAKEGIKYVILSPRYKNVMVPLQAAFPKVRFLSMNEAAGFLAKELETQDMGQLAAEFAGEMAQRQATVKSVEVKSKPVKSKPVEKTAEKAEGPGVEKVWALIPSADRAALMEKVKEVKTRLASMNLTATDAEIVVSLQVGGIMDLRAAGNADAAARKMALLAITIGGSATKSLRDAFLSKFPGSTLPGTEKRGLVVDLLEALPSRAKLEAIKALLALNPKQHYALILAARTGAEAIRKEMRAFGKANGIEKMDSRFTVEVSQGGSDGVESAKGLGDAVMRVTRELSRTVPEFRGMDFVITGSSEKLGKLDADRMRANLIGRGSEILSDLDEVCVVKAVELSQNFKENDAAIERSGSRFAFSLQGLRAIASTLRNEIRALISIAQAA